MTANTLHSCNIVLHRTSLGYVTSLQSPIFLPVEKKHITTIFLRLNIDGIKTLTITLTCIFIYSLFLPPCPWETLRSVSMCCAPSGCMLEWFSSFLFLVAYNSVYPFVMLPTPRSVSLSPFSSPPSSFVQEMSTTSNRSTVYVFSSSYHFLPFLHVGHSFFKEFAVFFCQTSFILPPVSTSVGDCSL